MADALNPEELNAVVLGSGTPPLLMLHGWGQSLGSLQALAELLAKSRQVHLLDLPGFGKSPKPKTDWGTEDYAQCVAAYMQKQGLARADILGHSFGGRIAVRLASAQPQVVSRLVLINAAGLPRQLSGRPSLRARLAKASLHVSKWLDRTFALNTFKEWHVPRFASADYKNAGELRAIFVKTVNEDLSAQAKQVICPTLLLWGELDYEVPVASAKRYAGLISSSHLVILPGKDHFPFLNEGAHLCAYHILKFLDTAPVTSSCQTGQKNQKDQENQENQEKLISV